jgi:hypothetical protein
MTDNNTKKQTPTLGDNPPYIYVERVVVNKFYNLNYGDDRTCKCGHAYYRHFDTYEEMEAIGCKYCQCREFVEATPEELIRIEHEEQQRRRR